MADPIVVTELNTVLSVVESEGVDAVTVVEESVVVSEIVTGLKGDKGDAGNTWHGGTADPTTEGVDGDWYLNRATWHVWEKVAEAWTDRGSIQGAPGAGDVTGPSSATDGGFALFDGVTGKLIKASTAKPADYAPISHVGATGAVHGNATAGGVAGFMTAVDKTKIDGIEAGADVTDAGNVGAAIHGSTAKTTMAEADTLAMIDSEASNGLKKLSWGYVKSILKTYFDSIYQAAGTYLGSLADDTTPELTGALDCNNKAVYWDLYTISGTTINVANGNKQKLTLSTTNITVTLSTPAGPTAFHLFIYQGSTARTITWPTILWAGGTAPDLTTASAKYVVCLVWDGTSWYGSWAKYS